jgi:hypothetical protein
MAKLTRILFYLCLWIILSGCVTSIDDKLPYAQLPAITVATQSPLVASPAHPTSFLPSEPIVAGEQVRVIGMDSNAAWLLVLHGDTIGWIPSIYSRTNVGTLKPALRIDPLPDKCTKYLGATFAPDEAWVSGVAGDLIVVGSIYRPAVGRQFQNASLAVEIAGQGTAWQADYVHPPLTTTSSVVLFTFALTKLQQDSRIHFDLANHDSERFSFQAAFFSTDCPDDLNKWEHEFVDRLPVGQAKLALPRRVATPTRTAPSATTPTPTSRPLSPTPTPTLLIIQPTPHGPPAPPQVADLPAEIEQVLRDWDLIHHESDRTLDPSAIPTVLTGAALTQQQQTLQKLRQGNCYWEFTDLAPSETLAYQPISANEAIVDVRKHWDGRLYCNGRFSERDSFNDPFFIRYRLIRTDGWRIAEKKTINEDELMSSSSGASPSGPITTPPAQPGRTGDPLRASLLAKSQNSAVGLVHRPQAEAFLDSLLRHLDDFQLPNLGITRRTMTDALGRADAGDRVNSLVQEVWADWESNARSRKFDAATADPAGLGFSPFRQLVIRLIQNRQGRLSDSQQHALHNYFTRAEDSSVWRRDPDAVIGAINRESFRWP